MSKQVFPQAPSPTMTNLRRISAICATPSTISSDQAVVSDGRKGRRRHTATSEGAVVVMGWCRVVGRGSGGQERRWLREAASKAGGGRRASATYRVCCGRLCVGVSLFAAAAMALSACAGCVRR